MVRGQCRERRLVHLQRSLVDRDPLCHLRSPRTGRLDALGAGGSGRMTPRKVAVVGGECTGKTVLCQQLAARLPGLWVPEYLREFVDRRGRVPCAEDQPLIFAAQTEREAAATDAALKTALRWVACDSAPIATAI